MTTKIHIKLNTKQKEFLEDILLFKILDKFAANKEWYNFNKNFNVVQLKSVGEYWAPININERIQSILEKGNYTIMEKPMLNAVRMYYLNQDKIT